MSQKNKKQKRSKREKITWVDDGSTIVDMSGVGNKQGRSNNPNQTPSKNRNGKPHSRFRECAATYFAAVKMMLIPMFVVIGIICVVFLLLYLAMGGMA